MHHHTDLLFGQTVQPHGFDDLKPFIHHGGGVDGDLLPHVPGGMLEGIRLFYGFQFFKFLSVERASGGCQNQPFDLPPVTAAHEALENGTVLRIHRHDLRPVFLRRVHHQFTGTHQRLLVGKTDAFFLFNGRKGGSQTYHAHDGGNDSLCLLHSGGGDQSFHAVHDPDTKAGKPRFQFLCGFLSAHNAEPGHELPCLLLHPVNIFIGRQSADFNTQMLRH